MTRAIPVIAATMLVAACGGGGSDDKSPTVADARSEAVIDSAQTAAQAAAYIGVINDIDGLADARGLDDEFRGKAARTVMKFRLEDDCAGGGSFAAFDDNNPEMLTVQFDDCTTGEGDVLDGQVQLQCQAGSFQDDSCSNVLITWGVSQKPFSFRDARRTASLIGPWRVITSSTSVRVEQSLELLARDDTRGLQAAAVTQNFFSDLEQDGNGGGLASIGGSAGAAFRGPNVECATGLVTFTTLERVQIDAQGQLVGGRVRVSNTSGQSAEVAFSSDGTANVTYNGATESFPASRFRSFCELDDGS